MSSSTSSSDAPGADARVRRSLWLAAGVACGVLALLVAVVLGTRREALAEAGRDVLTPRDRLLEDTGRARRGDPLLVFVGDSTLRPPRPYPKRIEKRLASSLPDAEVRMLWAPGLGPAEHYLLLARVLEQQPDVVVLLAHLRMFRAEGPLWQPDLLTLLPPRDLSRALLLPFHAHGIGAARLVLASLWGEYGSEDWLRLFAGGQERARKTPGLRWLTPMRRRLREVAELEPREDAPTALYGDRLYPGHPDLELLGASIELARSRGARVLVLVSPVPVHRFEDAGTLALADFEGRVEQLRACTRRSGGELLDLHALLGPDDFADALGHPSAAGHRRIADRLEPWLGRALADAAAR